MSRPTTPPPGRGTERQPPNRFERIHLEVEPIEADPDGEETGPRPTPTEYYRDASRSVIALNDSPDVPFRASLNPYRGCEHGCIYCYARPTHEYLGLSSGLDFESRIFVKEDAPARLREELSHRRWSPQVLALSGVTDPYQPVERRLELTRRCLQVLAEFRNPVGVITKNHLVTRDADVLGELAGEHCANVAVTVTTLDESLRRRLEPRTSRAELRLEAVARLNEAGVPAGVMIAPVIPGLTDHEIPAMLTRAAEAGARFAGYIMLRLPFAVRPLFEDWLDTHYPDSKTRVLGRIAQLHGGKLNDAHFGSRMRGEGPLADLVADLFANARRRVGIPARAPDLRTNAFRRPGQQALFDHDLKS